MIEILFINYFGMSLRRGNFSNTRGWTDTRKTLQGKLYNLIISILLASPVLLS